MAIPLDGLASLPNNAQGKAAPVENDKISGLDIYVDDSASMQGFVRRPASNFVHIVSNALLLASSSTKGVRVFPMSSTVPEPDSSLARLSRPEFYSRPDTPLAALLERIAGQQDPVSIVVSDLVQSEKSSDTDKLLAALRTLAVQKREMRIYGFRSDFFGKYYPESHTGGGSFDVDTTQHVPSEGRPFYLLVIAPNPGTMKQIEQYMLGRLEPAYVFDPSTPAFDVQDMSLPSEAQDKLEWRKYARFQKRNSDTAQFDSAFRWNGTADRGGFVDLPLRAKLVINKPLGEPSAMLVTGKSGQWKNDRFDAIGPVELMVKESPYHPTPHAAKANAAGADSRSRTVDFVLRVPAPAKAAWQGYHLQIYPRPGSLVVPDWVRQWDSEDDSRSSEIGKTYRLLWLIQTMENAITEHRSCGEWILRIGGKG